LDRPPFVYANPFESKVPLDFCGCCLKTEVFKQLYYIKNGFLKYMKLFQNFSFWNSFPGLAEKVEFML
jgi:hypothetical protein